MTVIRLFAGIAALLLAGLAASVTLAQSSYQIQPGDTLNIEVLEDPALTRSVVVLPDGSFNFPFAGTLRAGGRTVDQVRSTITSSIASNFAAPPNVFVTVVPIPPPPPGAGKAQIDVYFLGELNTPGLAQVDRGTTLMQALAVSGGFSRFAATKRIQLRRTDKRSGQQTVTQINYKALVNGALATTDIELRDGDIIIVPERRLFE